MTDQPDKAENTPKGDEVPAGYEPPSYVPPAPKHGENQNAEQPFAPPVDPGPYGQPRAPYGQQAPSSQEPAYTQPAPPYGQPPQGQPGYGQPAYGLPASPYGQPAYYGMPLEPKGLSIASMCCGIAVFLGFGFFFLPQIAAVILGHMALKREPAGKGMAIAGLVMGYLGLALFVIFFAIFAILAASASRYNYNY